MGGMRVELDTTDVPLALPSDARHIAIFPLLGVLQIHIGQRLLAAVRHKSFSSLIIFNNVTYYLTLK